MQSVILAAGMGKRLKELTQNNTKCMVPVNGVTLIERTLRQLKEQNVSRVIMVVGYEGDKLISFIESLHVDIPVIYVYNKSYETTNNIYSLFLARDYLCEDDTILIESDLIFSDEVLDMLIRDPRDTLALVDKYECWMDGTCVQLTDDDRISSFIPGKNLRYEDIDSYYKTVNIYKFSKHFSEHTYVPFLEAYSAALGNNEYYEEVLRIITLLDEPGIRAKRLTGQTWYEIDDIQDLDIASSMFVEDDDRRLALMQGRFGGYWRYPKLLDFCNPGNPFYPPQKMIDEIRANLERVITAYPSGMNVISLLVSKNLSIPREHIAVSNGAEEIIQTIISSVSGKIGIVRPTNEEYVQRLNGNGIIDYHPRDGMFVFDFKDIADFFDGQEIGYLIISNPNIHTGRKVDPGCLIEIIKWARLRHVMVLLDETYVDFAENATLTINKAYADFDNLIIIKNLSESHGIQGLRIGCAVSANQELIRKLRRELPVWNINSVAEFYLQIEEKYKKEYMASIVELRKERNRLMDSLRELSKLKPIPSDAGFVMCELVNGACSSHDLTRELLGRYNILVKDVTDRINNGRQYVKFSVRGEADDRKLVNALIQIFNDMR